jgi:hypothetical protein
MSKKKGSHRLCQVHDFTYDDPTQRTIEEALRRDRLDSSDHEIYQKDQAAQIYTKIGKSQLRILELLPGDPGEPVAVKLQLAELSGNTAVRPNTKRQIAYEAVSYCWGKADSFYVVSCDGISFPVRKNLYMGLQRLRAQNEPRTLWIDALCINQTDLDERSNQVGKMLHIFSHAENVLAWLGEARESSAFLLRCIAEASKQSSGIDELQLCPQHEALYKDGVHDLQVRPWYQRTWIKQEAWVARKLDVVCGNQQVSWSAFTHAADRIDGRVNEAFRNFRPLLVDLEATEHGRNWRQGFQFELADALHLTAGSRCSDPRDHVYGVLGMTKVQTISAEDSAASEPEEPSLIVDYRRTASQVYQDIILYAVQESNSIKILSELKDSRGSRTVGLNTNLVFGGFVNGEVLPSWCPNFSMSKVQPKKQSWNPKQHIALVKCSMLSHQYIPTSLPSTLTLQGIAIGPDVGPPSYSPIRYKMMPGFCRRLAAGIEAQQGGRAGAIALMRRLTSATAQVPMQHGIQSSDEFELYSVFERISIETGTNESLRLGWHDLIVAVRGARDLLILRPVEGSETFRFLDLAKFLAPGPNDAVSDLIDDALEILLEERRAIRLLDRYNIV